MSSPSKKMLGNEDLVKNEQSYPFLPDQTSSIIGMVAASESLTLSSTLSEENRIVDWRRTYRTYLRNSATVMVANVMRIWVDSIFISVLNQNPDEVEYGFLHCTSKDHWRCIGFGTIEFFSIVICSGSFVWHYQEWLVDPSCNRFASVFSWGILTGALEWLPLGIAIMKVIL